MEGMIKVRLFINENDVIFAIVSEDLDSIRLTPMPDHDMVIEQMDCTVKNCPNGADADWVLNHVTCQDKELIATPPAIIEDIQLRGAQLFKGVNNEPKYE